MRLPPVPLLITLALAAQATTSGAHAGGLPVCNAKHKRPANLYGSVLSAGLSPAPAAASGSDAKAIAPVASRVETPAPKPQQVSRAEWRAAFAPCGRAPA